MTDLGQVEAQIMERNLQNANTELSDQLCNANYPARACASKGLCDRSWCLYIVVISLDFFLEPIFYLPKYSLSEVYFNTSHRI